MTTKTIKAETEFRSFNVAPIELREGSDTLTLEGYASVFDTPYEVGGFQETVKRGAFSKTLQERSIATKLLINHEGLPLASAKSGTLQLSEDDRGLMVRAELDPSDPDVQSLVPKMRRGDLDEMSFGFRTIKDSWNEDMSQRSLEEVRLYDVSVVTYPANPATSVVLRKLDEISNFFGVAPEQLAAIIEMRASGVALNSSHIALLKTIDAAIDGLLSDLGIVDPDEPGGEPPESITGDDSQMMINSWKDKLAEQRLRLSA